MNIKVVIVWIFAIILLFGLGIIGYLNQDLLLLKEDTYIPKPIDGASSQTKTCTATLANATSTYNFTIDNDKITTLTMIYKANNEDMDGYASASNINQFINVEKVDGVSAIMSGSTIDFSLTVNVLINNYDKARVEELNADFTKLSMVIDTIDDYETYKQAMANLGATYTCE